jgi:uncharacterized protein
MARERAFDLHRLDVRAFTAAAATLQGEAAQATFTRLADSVLALPGDSLPPPVAWQAQGEQRPAPGGPAQPWLHLQAQTRVALQCQRCLQPMHEALQVDRWFRFVDNEDEAARLDEESEDDVLVVSRAFDLAELLEDELILALPIVPRHEQCPEPLPLPADDDDAEEEAAPNPFAALAALRRPPGGG